MVNIKAYREGVKAFEEGLLEQHNTYISKGDRDSWFKGYYSGETEQPPADVCKGCGGRWSHLEGCPYT